MIYPHATEFHLDNPEVCLNLWAYVSEDGHIMRIAGKTYVLQGEDKDKLAALHLLAATDFLSTPWSKVPANFKHMNADSGGIRPPIPEQSGPPVPEQSGPGIPL